MSDCFLVELDGIQFSEEDNVKWIHAMSPGKYIHPLKGTIEFTQERIHRFAENVKNRVRGIDLDIDYDHKDKTNEAAGWIKDAEARPDGLWLLVELTADGARKVKEKAYRYFSPDYYDVWVDPAGKQFTDVLAGGGLTNRPFLKDLTPINLSEIIGGNSMLLDELRKLLGLPETADDATILAKAQELKVALDGVNTGSDPAPTQPEPTPDPQPEPVEPQAPQAAVDTAPANDPVMAQLSERIMLLEAEKRHRDVTDFVTKLSEGNAVTIAPALLDEVKSLALNSPDEVGKQWMSLLHKIKSEGLVQLSEVGGNPNPVNREGGRSAITSLHEQAEALMLSEKVSFEDAVIKLTSENPDLGRQYRTETMIKEGA